MPSDAINHNIMAGYSVNVLFLEPNDELIVSGAHGNCIDMVTTPDSACSEVPVSFDVDILLSLIYSGQLSIIDVD